MLGAREVHGVGRGLDLAQRVECRPTRPGAVERSAATEPSAYPTYCAVAVDERDPDLGAQAVGCRRGRSRRGRGVSSRAGSRCRPVRRLRSCRAARPTRCGGRARVRTPCARRIGRRARSASAACSLSASTCTSIGRPLRSPTTRTARTPPQPAELVLELVELRPLVRACRAAPPLGRLAVRPLGRHLRLRPSEGPRPRLANKHTADRPPCVGIRSDHVTALEACVADSVWAETAHSGQAVARAHTSEGGSRPIEGGDGKASAARHTGS